jgi:TRAP-type uncharacterized transport system fused permease subunit
MQIAMNAVRIGWVAYIIPFMFVFAPSLLLVGSPGRISLAIATALIGIYCVTGGITGYLLGELRLIERLAFAVGGVVIAYPSYFTDYVGLGIIVLALIYRVLQWTRNRRISNSIASSQSEKGGSA